MKVKVSFELDLSENPSLNIDTLKNLRGCLQNLSAFFHELHCHHLEKICKAHTRDSETRDILLKIYEADAAVSKQLFDNYTVEGVTDDGHDFVSNHQEPGYKEIMKIDGEIVRDF